MSGPRYPIPSSSHRIEQVIERSRFICTLAPARTTADAQSFVKAMNAEFPDATHNCWAYVVGPPGSTSQVGMSDAGEPHGTAGRPMLTVLLHSGVGDVAAVVTRYFGGTKLGTGGLVKAYGGAVQEALASLPTVERVEYATVTIEVAYPAVSALQQLWPVHEVRVLAEDYGEAARFTVQVPEGNLDALRARIMDATRGQAGFTSAG